MLTLPLLSLSLFQVDNNALETIPEALGTLPKLEVLNLSMNKLTTLAPLAGGELPNLLTFAASDNELAEVELPFATMSRCSCLNI